MNLFDLPNKYYATEFISGKLWNPGEYNNTINLYKGINNNISFTIKNTDSKPVNLINATITINFIDPYLNKILLTTTMNIEDYYKGKVYLNLPSTVIADWPTGILKYTLVKTVNGNDVPLYIDITGGVSGVVQISNEVVPEPNPPVVVTSFITQAHGISDITYFASTPIPGSMQTGNTSGLHTILIKTKNFTGNMYFQASLENSTPTNTFQWFDILPDNVLITPTDHQCTTEGTVFPGESLSVQTLDNACPIYVQGFTGTISCTITGNLQWLEFQYFPTIVNYGTIRSLSVRS